MPTEHDHQDIARSSYADMLLDDERNRAYDAAIRLSVYSLVRSSEHNPEGNRYFKCCDVGTGSGLLSMMVVRAFKELNYENFHVYAFEAFQPMAICAEKVININGMKDFITVYPERSDRLSEKMSFDLLVAELLDTELIGEGCLSIYRHAVENLCSPTCLFVPHQARIYIEPVSSSFLFSRNAVSDYHIRYKRDISIEFGEEATDCPGRITIDDIQASQLEEGEDFIRFSAPKVAFTITFNDLNSLKLENHVSLDFPVEKNIDQPPVIIMWWDIVMYNKALTSSDYSFSEDLDRALDVLSCAPTWARSGELLQRDQMIKALYGRDVWREHWIQGVYHFRNVAAARKLVGTLTLNTDSLTIHAHHDSHSLWFNLDYDNSKPHCSCGAHMRQSQVKLSFLSDKEQMKKILSAHLNTFVFEGNPQIIAKVGLQSSYANPDYSWKIKFFGTEGQRLDSYIEPLYYPGLQDRFPWESWMQKSYFSGQSFLSGPFKNFKIKCTQVQFDNLNRVNMKVGRCEGFNLDDLDAMIKDSSEKVDKSLEMYQLWEYPCKRIDSDHLIYSSDEHGLGVFKDSSSSETHWTNLYLKVKNRGDDNWKKGWALVFWAEFRSVNNRDIISTGPVEECAMFSYFKWNKHSYQLVYFMDDHPIENTGPVNHITLDVGLAKGGCLFVQRAVDYNTSLKKLKGGEDGDKLE